LVPGFPRPALRRPRIGAAARIARNVASTASVRLADLRWSGVPFSMMDRSTCGGKMQKME
jgi:hypothetical protein